MTIENDGPEEQERQKRLASIIRVRSGGMFERESEDEQKLRIIQEALDKIVVPDVEEFVSSSEGLAHKSNMSAITYKDDEAQLIPPAMPLIFDEVPPLMSKQLADAFEIHDKDIEDVQEVQQPAKNKLKLTDYVLQSSAAPYGIKPQSAAQTGANMHLAIQAEIHWPEEKRVIYCKLTGQPFGTISPDYINKVLRTFDIGEQNKFETFMNDHVIFSGPCPLWQRRDDTVLIRNKKTDPVGFFIYMFQHMISADTTVKTYDDVFTMQRNKTACYANLEAQCINAPGTTELLDNLNELLLIFSGEGKLPPPAWLPSYKLSYYANSDALFEFLTSLKSWQTALKKKRGRKFAEWQRHQSSGGLTTSQTSRLAAPQHKHLAELSLGIDHESFQTQDDTFDVITAMLLDIDKASYTKKERLTLFKKTGDTSPLKAELTLAAKAIVKAQQDSAAKDKAGFNPLLKQHVMLTDIKQFTFGKKKAGSV